MNVSLNNIKGLNFYEYRNHLINNIPKVNPSEEFRVVGKIGQNEHPKHLISNFLRIYTLKRNCFFNLPEKKWINVSILMDDTNYLHQDIAWTVFKGKVPKNHAIFWNEELQGTSLVDKLEIRNISLSEHSTKHLTYLLHEEITKQNNGKNYFENEQWSTLCANLLKNKDIDLSEIAVSNFGRVKIDDGFAKLNIEKGYVHIQIKNTHLSVHRLLASAFVKNEDPDSFVFVNHINEIKSDNRADNFEWVTPSENTTFSIGTPIKITNIETKEEHFFNSIQHARSFNMNGKKHIQQPTFPWSSRQKH